MFNHTRSGKSSTRPRLFLEELEARTLLSASPLDNLLASPQVIASQASLSAAPQVHGGGSKITNPNPSPGAFTPSQIGQAYGFNQITFSNGIKGDGSGQTIAIVDAYNDPHIQSDLNTFDTEFHLPSATLSIAMPQGKPLTNSGWAMEISLDVEWAHAMAPGAKILLVEAQSNSLSNLLGAVDYASNQPGVSVISTSWGGSEFASESLYDFHFNHAGVTFVASSGDRGAPPSWPAVSPNVVAVGGTSLTTDSTGNYVSETGWSGSGGGISAYEPKPTYQSSVTQSSTQRTNPDVAYNADPNTGYAIYDTVPYYGQTGWFEVGGTSAGAPQWSALVAIADQGRQLANNNTPNPLGGVSQTLPAVYNMSSSDFHDITSGNNGFSAGPGYDLVTGRGTPYANLVVQALVSATSSGSVPTPLVTTSSSSTSLSTAASHALAPTAGNAAESVAASNSSAVSGTASSFGQAPASSVPSALTSAESVFVFSPSSMSGIASSIGQATASSSTLFGGPISVPGPNAVSAALTAFSTFMLPGSGSANSARMAGEGGTVVLPEDGPPAPTQNIPAVEQGNIDVATSPAVPAGARGQETATCDACFADETSMALLAADSMAPARNDNEEWTGLRGPGLALLGLLAGRFWMEPASTAETKERRPRLWIGLAR